MYIISGKLLYLLNLHQCIFLLLRIYLCGNHLPTILEQLSNSSDTAAMKALIIDPLKEFIEDLDKFQQMVEQTIDLDAADKGDFMVKPDFDEELKGTYNLYCLFLHLINF